MRNGQVVLDKAILHQDNFENAFCLNLQFQEVCLQDIIYTGLSLDQRVFLLVLIQEKEFSFLVVLSMKSTFISQSHATILVDRLLLKCFQLYLPFAILSYFKAKIIIANTQKSHCSYLLRIIVNLPKMNFMFMYQIKLGHCYMILACLLFL